MTRSSQRPNDDLPRSGGSQALDLGGQNETTRELTVPLCAESHTQLTRYAQSRDVGPDICVATAWMVLLSKLSDDGHIELGVEGLDQVETVLRVDICADSGFNAVVDAVTRKLKSQRSTSGEGHDDGHTTFAKYSMLASTEGAALASGQIRLALSSAGGHAAIRASARVSGDRSYAVEPIVTSVRSLLEQALADPERRIGDLQMVTGPARHTLLREFNATDAPFDARPMHLLFEARVAENPDRLAVHDGETQLTYAELNARANRVAHRLRRLGLARNEMCGIYVDRSVSWCVAMMAILKAGGAFVSLDTSHPKERSRFMLLDSACKFLLGESKSAFGSQPKFIDLLSLDLDEESPVNPVNVNELDDRAYVIYTSGTTGTPKGVPLRHEGIASFAQHYLDSFGLGPADNVLNFFSFSFDGSVSEMTMALFAGTGFYILPEQVKSNYRRFESYLNEHAITAATIPPPYLAYLDPDAFTSLRLIFVAGSASTKKLLDPWTAGYDLVNHYGPTEVTICASEWKSPRTAIERPSVPIGAPIANKKIYIVASNGELAPLGTRGELCVSGLTLSQGYLNRPELSAEKFVENPFVAEVASTHDHRRMYRTGDSARWLPDGTLEFLGRLDDQVKIRGYRVELGEVEHSMLNHEGIREAVAIAVGADKVEASLDGYYVGSVDAKQLRAHLAAALPDYMVPTRLLKLDELPRTANDKVDRQQLLAMAADVNSSETDHPDSSAWSGSDGTTHAILELLATAREGDFPPTCVAADDHLDDLGINSLRFIKLMMAIEDRFNLEFEGDFFVQRKQLRVGDLLHQTHQRIASAPCPEAQ